MSIHVALRHTTVYTFDRSIKLGPHIIRLRPAQSYPQRRLLAEDHARKSLH